MSRFPPANLPTFPEALASGSLAPHWWFVCPPPNARSPALQALRQWLHDEMDLPRALPVESGR